MTTSTNKLYKSSELDRFGHLIGLHKYAPIWARLSLPLLQSKHLGLLTYIGIEAKANKYSTKLNQSMVNDSDKTSRLLQCRSAVQDTFSPPPIFDPTTKPRGSTSSTTTSSSDSSSKKKHKKEKKERKLNKEKKQWRPITLLQPSWASRP